MVCVQASVIVRYKWENTAEFFDSCVPSSTWPRSDGSRLTFLCRCENLTVGHSLNLIHATSAQTLRIFVKFCTRVPVGNLNCYPVFTVVMLQHTPSRPSGAMPWGKDNPPPKFTQLENFLYRKNAPVGIKFVNWTIIIKQYTLHYNNRWCVVQSACSLLVNLHWTCDIRCELHQIRSHNGSVEWTGNRVIKIKIPG